MFESSPLFGPETWKIANVEKKRIEAVEMHVFRKSLGVSQLKRIRNEEIRLQE